MESEKPAEEELKYETGCILKLVDLPEKLNYREIKEELFKHAKVQYVDIMPQTRTVSFDASIGCDRLLMTKLVFFSFSLNREQSDLHRKKRPRKR